MFRKILVPIDGSPCATAAVERAVALAKSFGSSISLLLANDLSDVQLSRMSDPARAEMLRAVSEANEAVLGEAAALCASRGVSATTRQLMGDPVATIAAEAEREGSDLIVMGSRGLGLAEADYQLIGSVTDRVLRRVRCPVLVVRC